MQLDLHVVKGNFPDFPSCWIRYLWPAYRQLHGDTLIM